MAYTAEDLAKLDELQAIDFKALNLKRTFDTLPQRQTILELRKQLAELEERKQKVAEPLAKAQAQVDDVLVEQQKLADKKASIDAMVKDNATGYREAEARQKELASIAKRQETLAHRMTGYQAELDKWKAVSAKIDAAFDQLAAREAAEVESFKTEGTALKKAIAEAKAQREEFAPGLDATLLAQYEKAAQRCGGVGVAHLNGNTCSVCRGTIDSAHLHQMQHEAPLSACPLCRRMMIL